MSIELNIPILIVVNVVACPAIQLGLAWLFTRLPSRWFSDKPTQAPVSHLDLYTDYFQVKRWKDQLPDGASWFGGGFPKKHLREVDAAYLRRFISETRRGEYCHWTAIAASHLSILWNPWWGFLIVFAWFLVSNLPCIIVQRYNRLRLSRAVGRLER